MESKGKKFYLYENSQKSDAALHEEILDGVEYLLELRKDLQKVAMECGLTEEQAELIYHCNEEKVMLRCDVQARFTRCFSDEQMRAMSRHKLPHLLNIICDMNNKCEYAIDIHLRENSEIMVYHGGTCLLTIGVSGIEQNKISFRSKSYGMKDGCTSEFNLLNAVTTLDDVDATAIKVCAFLSKVISTKNLVHDRYFKNMKEGYWSNRLSIAYGRNWKPENEWLIIDRESVLGFDNVDDKNNFFTKYKDAVQSIKNMLQQSAPRVWGRPNEKTDDYDFGDELDFLAIGPKNQLVCIELKHGTYTSGIYWGPLQAAVYREVFSSQLDRISTDIITMVRQRVELGLLPKLALERLPDNRFACVEGVLAVADYESSKNSSCWGKAIKVNDELGKVQRAVKMVRSNGDMLWEDSSKWK
ncbi:MAG: hypothetical protein LWW87_14775 [Geobacteraceae bacterium]|nr:hypothetical protein [Geobacteraceae bacterium]